MIAWTGHSVLGENQDSIDLHRIECSHQFEVKRRIRFLFLSEPDKSLLEFLCSLVSVNFKIIVP